jgi:Divergent InlB B-repeat domain
MSLIDKMKTGIAALLAGLPQTNTENHAAVTAGLGDALGGPVQESVDELNAQMAALNARMDAIAAENAAALAAAVASLGTRIDNVPVYTPPSCLSYRISNTATESNPSTDVQYTFKDCTGAVSAPITLFAGDSATVCADGLPKIVVGQSNARIDALGQSSCPPVSGSTPTIGFITTPTIEVSGGNTVPATTPNPTPQLVKLTTGAAPLTGLRLDIGDLTGDFSPVVAVTINGQVSTAKFPNVFTKSVPEGTTVSFEATPLLRSWRFVGWTDRSNTTLSTSRIYTATITSEVTVIARYMPT